MRQEAASLLVPVDGCGQCLDVEARVVVHSLWQSGTVEGYLLARAPGALKFVGLSPVGQPLLVLATDGSSFRFLSVAAATAYEGATTAAAFRKYAPAGLDPHATFFWLIGRLPRDSRIIGVSRDEAGNGYWLALANGAEGDHRVLFDPAGGAITRAVLLDQDGQPLLEVTYEAYRQVEALGGAAGCRLPGRVTVSGPKQKGAALAVHFSNWLLGTTCSDADFVVPVPPGFATEKVE
ncbi:MAG: DUF4292 domain-containing protein [Thermodesulfobacteriota bacterium]